MPIAAPTERCADGLVALRSRVILLVFTCHDMVLVSGAPTFGWVGDDGYAVLAFYFRFPAVMSGNSPPPLWSFLTFAPATPPGVGSTSSYPAWRSQC